MPASPTDPPLGAPVRELKSANTADGFYWELVSREGMQWQLNSPLKRGTKYSDIRGAKQSVIDAHPTGLWFCEEIVPLRSSQVGGMPGDRFVIWVWSTDWAAQSSTNAGVTYSEESVSHPIYTRDYLIRRDVWQTTPTIALGTALTALVGATITAGGTGYTTATGTIGNATCVFVCSGGAIISAIVTSEGSGISSGGAITITGDGAGATATAVIQPASAVLVKQEKSELPADSNMSKEFVLVRRTYETLPGPILEGRHTDETTGIAVDYTKQVVLSSSTPSAGYTERQPIDSFRSIEIVSTLDATSLPASSTYYGSIRHSWPDITSNFALNGVISGDDFAIGFSFDHKKGYSGPCQARFTETFAVGPPGSGEAPTITKYYPQSEQFAFYYAAGGNAKIWEFRVPESLHAAWTPTITGWGGAAGTGTVNATTPTSYTANDYDVVDMQVDKWRFGVYRTLKIEARIPPFT